MLETNYLLQSREEAQSMVQKIRQLIESGEKSNIDLALQLMQGGGVPPSLLTYVAVVAIFFDDSLQTKQFANQLWQNWASAEAQAVVGDLQSSFYRPFNEKDMRIQLQMMQNYQVFEINDLANLTFKMSGLGASFCLANQTRPILGILNELVEDNSLDLSNFQLEYLPNEICELTELTRLDLRHNLFTHLPEEIGKLGKLNHLHLKGTPLAKTEELRLKKILPKVVANQKFDQGQAFYSAGKYKQAVNAFEEATNILPDFALAWNWKGYCHKFLNNHTISRVCLERSIELDANDVFAWANLVEVLCALGEYQLTLEICDKKLQIFSHLSQKTNQDKVSLANLWFFKGLAHFWRAEYDQAHQANDQSIAINNFAGAWYNKACSYSKQHNKSDMLFCLEKAILMNRRNTKLLKEDKDRDFEAYYDDPDFIALKGKLINKNRGDRQ
jgi:tetratricopeptide (TPR) repeat protein